MVQHSTSSTPDAFVLCRILSLTVPKQGNKKSKQNPAKPHNVGTQDKIIYPVIQAYQVPKSEILYTAFHEHLVVFEPGERNVNVCYVIPYSKNVMDRHSSMVKSDSGCHGEKLN